MHPRRYNPAFAVALMPSSGSESSLSWYWVHACGSKLRVHLKKTFAVVCACVTLHILMCAPGNFRGFKKPLVRSQLKLSFLQVARSWFSIK